MTSKEALAMSSEEALAIAQAELEAARIASEEADQRLWQAYDTLEEAERRALCCKRHRLMRQIIALKKGIRVSVGYVFMTDGDAVSYLQEVLGEIEQEEKVK